MIAPTYNHIKYALIQSFLHKLHRRPVSPARNALKFQGRKPELKLDHIA